MLSYKDNKYMKYTELIRIILTLFSYFFLVIVLIRLANIYEHQFWYSFGCSALAGALTMDGVYYVFRKVNL